MTSNEQNKDQMIRDIYQNVQAPDDIKDRISETLNMIKQQESSGSAAQNTRKRHEDSETAAYRRKRHKKPLSFKKITAIAIAAALGIGGTAFAAVRIYQLQLEKDKEYQRNLSISTENELPKEVEEVEVKAEYIPEGFTFNENKHYYVNENKDAGYTIGEPALIDEADPLSVSYVRDAEQLTIDGHDAVYLSINHTTDENWRNDKLFVVYEELDRVLPFEVWGHAEKDELIKIAENVKLTPTGKKAASKDLPRWSEIVESPVGKAVSDENTAEYGFKEASEEQMANVHQIGDSFAVYSFLRDGGADIQLEATVRNVQVADDLSLITNEEAIWPSIYESWKALVGPDGKLTSDTLTYAKLGDGAESMPEIVRTEEKQVKLVYAEVEYKNTSSKTYHDAWYFADLIPIVKNGNTCQVFDRADETCDYVENENTGVRNIMCYADVSGGGSGPKNYIPEIKPGESVTIRFAWLVNEDELDKLYLNLRGETVFTDEGLEIGFVDLKL